LQRRNDRGYRKRPEESGKQDVKIDSGRRKKSPGDEDYRHRKEERGYKREDIEADEDYKRRREERGHKRQDIEADDHPRRRHHGDRR